MAQLVDLGSHSLRTSCPKGRCLVSRATATLIRSDSLNATEPKNHRFDFLNAWVTLKQELFVDLYIEACLDPGMSMPKFIKQVVETVQASLISDSLYLRTSTMDYEYRWLGSTVVLHVSVVLRKVPHISPRRISKRLPRKVNECAAEPHSPPGIDRATLSHIAVYMRTVEQCTAWNLFLAKLWLKNPHNHEQDPRTSPKSKIVTLCRPHSSLKLPIRKTADTLIEQTRCLASGDNYVRQPNNFPERKDIESAKHCINLTQMVECSLWCLVRGNKQCKSLLNRWTIEEGPSLLDVAPTLFKAGHYENVRQRAGLIPVVTRSMARIFRTCQFSSVKEKISSVKSNLRSRYGNCTDTEKTDSGHLSRSLIKCVVWTALQRGGYKVEWPKKSISEDSDTTLLTDDDLLTNGSDNYEDFDEQMLNSGINSVTRSDEIVSHCSDTNELDSGYSSLFSPEKLLPRFSDIESVYDEIYDDISEELAIDDDDFDVIAVPDTEGGDIIRSSSLPPAASDMCVENNMTSDPLLCSEVFNEDDLSICGSQHDEMDNSSAISISSSTYQYVYREI